MSDLKNRKRYTTSLDTGILEQLKLLSKQTKIPMSKLLDEAIEDLVKKYDEGNK